MMGWKQYVTEMKANLFLETITTIIKAPMKPLEKLKGAYLIFEVLGKGMLEMRVYSKLLLQKGGLDA